MRANSTNSSVQKTPAAILGSGSQWRLCIHQIKKIIRMKEMLGKVLEITGGVLSTGAEMATKMQLKALNIPVSTIKPIPRHVNLATKGRNRLSFRGISRSPVPPNSTTNMQLAICHTTNGSSHSSGSAEIHSGSARNCMIVDKMFSSTQNSSAYWLHTDDLSPPFWDSCRCPEE